MFNFIFEGKIGEILAPFDITSKSETGYSAIHVACRYNNIVALDLILQRGVPIDFPDNQNNTTLHYASKYGHFELCKLLIDRGCSPAKRNSSNKTAYDVTENHVIRQYLLPLQLSTNNQYGNIALPPEPHKPNFNNDNSFNQSFQSGSYSVPPMNPPTYHPPQSYPLPPGPGVYAQSNVFQPPVSSLANQESYQAIRKIKADGFHSSASDPELQVKYGHVKAHINIAPPPTAPIPGSQEKNAYSMGPSYSATSNVYNRYVPYDAHNNAPMPPPAYSNQPSYNVASSYNLPVPPQVFAPPPAVSSQTFAPANTFIPPQAVPSPIKTNTYVNHSSSQNLVDNIIEDEVVSADASSSALL
eukprot:gene18487-24200_t